MIKTGYVVEVTDLGYWDYKSDQLPIGMALIEHDDSFRERESRWITTIYNGYLYDFCPNRILKIIK